MTSHRIAFDRNPDLQRQMIDWRHRLHELAETGFEEVATSDYITKVLRELGLQVHRGFAFIGNGTAMERDGVPLHNSSYDFNDDILSVGARYFAEIARMTLAR